MARLMIAKLVTSKFIYQLNKIKKGFTLIELLIVVAIIGILAGVGIPMYNGYMTKAKVETSRANHVAIKNFLAASFTQCASGSSYIKLEVNFFLNTKWTNKIPCNFQGGGAQNITHAFHDYWHRAGFDENPWSSLGRDLPAVDYGKAPWEDYILGTITFVNVTGSQIKMVTNIGNESGGEVLLTDILVLNRMD